MNIFWQFSNSPKFSHLLLCRLVATPLSIVMDVVLLLWFVSEVQYGRTASVDEIVEACQRNRVILKGIIASPLHSDEGILQTLNMKIRYYGCFVYIYEDSILTILSVGQWEGHRACKNLISSFFVVWPNLVWIWDRKQLNVKVQITRIRHKLVELAVYLAAVLYWLLCFDVLWILPYDILLQSHSFMLFCDTVY